MLLTGFDAPVEQVMYIDKVVKARVDVEPKSVKILDLKHRWSSWTPGGNLNFHWKCMMSPAKILDYIVVHELAHLVHSNHSVRFWNEVDKLLPDYN